MRINSHDREAPRYVHREMIVSKDRCPPNSLRQLHFCTVPVLAGLENSVGEGAFMTSGAVTPAAAPAAGITQAKGIPVMNGDIKKHGVTVRKVRTGFLPMDWPLFAPACGVDGAVRAAASVRNVFVSALQTSQLPAGKTQMKAAGWS